MIRYATEDDILDVLILGKEFVREAPPMYKWNKDKVIKLLHSAVTEPSMCVIVHENEKGYLDSALLGMMSEMFMSDTIVATELAWFTTKESRGKPSSLKILKKFEEWAKEQGASYVSMADLAGLQNLGPVYERKGYGLVERSYLKEI